MNAWTRIRNLFVRENPLLSSWPGAAWWKFIPRDLQLSVPERAALGIVWACIRAISDPIASATWDVYTRNARGKRLLLPDDPYGWLLSVQPNPEMNAQSMWEFSLYAMATFGNAYVRIQRDRASRVIGLWPLLTERVGWSRDKPDAPLTYSYNQASGDQVLLEAADVLHFRGPMSTSTIFGDAAIDRAAKSIARGYAIDTFATSFFANGGVVSGWLEVPDRMTPEDKELLQRDFRAKHTGHKNAQRVAVFEGGTKYHPSEIDGDKSQMIPAHLSACEDIARAWGVPLGMINIGPAAQGYWNNYANVTLDFVRRVLKPWHGRLSQEIRIKLFPAKAPWRWVEPDLNHLSRGNELQRAQAAEVWVRSGVKSINEVRDQEGEDERTGADELLVPTSLQPLTRALEEPQPQPQLPASPGGDGEEDDPKLTNAAPKRAVAAEAVSQILAKHHARVKARTDDLKRAAKSPAEIQTAVEGLRTKASTEIKVVLELIQAVARPEDLYSAASAVEAGIEPAAAASHLIEGVAP